MKLSIVMLLLLVALVRTDTSYQNFESYESSHDLSSASSNYYEHSQPNRRISTGLTGYLRQYLNPIRRQGFQGVIPYLWPLGLLCIVIFLALIGYGYYSALYNSSGRGLDTDEWEVDHSVWMSQLQKDFEDSWSEH
ncbi:uncharacterized protein LOC122375590 [Amphibalanus amphitrite]|nr:uncharacterized protein LOC122372965 [Amphibalanus amphitrite]XP_043211025.1 uncharacterized protein LOC122375590 [Amphibalanus amphitrite]